LSDLFSKLFLDFSKVVSGGRDCAVVLWDVETTCEELKEEVARNIVSEGTIVYFLVCYLFIWYG